MTVELRYYQTSSFEQPFVEWLRGLNDRQARTRIEARLARVARKAHLTREATYKMLSKSGNPELRSLSAVLKATGLRISFKPIEKQAA